MQLICIYTVEFPCKQLTEHIELHLKTPQCRLEKHIHIYQPLANSVTMKKEPKWLFEILK